MVLPPKYKIHPSIGIARLGNATSFFIGPETPGLYPSGEAPGTAVPPYKDGGLIKRQAARFRIFEYVDNGNKEYAPSQEILPTPDHPEISKLIWTVHLANRKASFFTFEALVGWNPVFKDDPVMDLRTPRRRNPRRNDRRNLEIDPKPRSVSGRNADPVHFAKGTSSNPASELWPDPKPTPEIETLGELRTDSQGRLMVLGGKGKAGSIPDAPPVHHFANNDGWFDDVSDGPVTAFLQIKGTTVPVDPAWVICAPPDFAPHIANIVTLYDLMYDGVARKMAIPGGEALYTSGALKGLAMINREFDKAGRPILSIYQPDFATEIYPILYRAAAYMFVFGRKYGYHSPKLIKWTALASKDPQHEGARRDVFTFIRSPTTKASDSFPYMPKLLGEETGPVRHDRQRVRLTLTPTQYALLQQWANGNFIEPQVVPPQRVTGPNITPEGLDRAALESCVGGSFYPGIEAGWQTWSSSVYSEPFRVAPGALSPYVGDSGNTVRAGHFTRQMAVPWHADFLICKEEDDQTGVFPSTLDPWGWWPAQRPDWVFASIGDFNIPPPNGPKKSRWDRASRGGVAVPWPSGDLLPSYDEMLANWTKFGFVVEVANNIFIETERGTQDIP